MDPRPAEFHTNNQHRSNRILVFIIFGLIIFLILTITKLVSSNSKLHKITAELENLTAENQLLQNDNQKLQITEKSNLFYQRELYWTKCFSGERNKNSFSVYDYGFQIEQNAGKLGLACAVNFSEGAVEVNNNSDQLFLDCTVGASCSNLHFTDLDQERSCQQEFSQQLTNLKLVTPISFILSTTEVKPDQSEKYTFELEKGDRFDNYTITFYSPLPLNAKTTPIDTYYGKYSLLLKTYEPVDEVIIRDLVEDIISQISFINLSEDSNKCLTNFP